MPLLKSLRSLNWPGLVVELVLIFVGITAALWFDNIKEDREARRTESQVLRELVVSLHKDTADLHQNLRSSAQTRQSIDTILRYFDERRPYREDLAAHFRRSSLFTNFLQNPGVYEYLKSIGLSTITDGSLRAGIAEYYEYRVPYLRNIEALFLNGNWSDGMRPQMMEKFSYRFFFGPAVPHDYAALATDRRYRTLLETTKEILEWKDDRSSEVLDNAEALLVQIEGYLTRRGR